MLSSVIELTIVIMCLSLAPNNSALILLMLTLLCTQIHKSKQDGDHKSAAKCLDMQVEKGYYSCFPYTQYKPRYKQIQHFLRSFENGYWMVGCINRAKCYIARHHSLHC